MTASIRTAAALFAGTALVTIVSAVVLSTAPGQPIAQAEVQQLPRVVVTGQVQRRTEIAELPRVVVTGRVHQAAAVVELPRVVVTGRIAHPLAPTVPVLAEAERNASGRV